MGKNQETKPPRLLSTLLRAPQGEVDVTRLSTDAAPGYPGQGKDDADDRRNGLAGELSELQERLFADGRSRAESARRVLVILQGLDTAGKGGVVRHAIGLVDPQGVRIKSFKVPTPEERAHDFLWRIERALPEPGLIGIFDRSQYEDVLVVRVDSLVPQEIWEQRYEQINAFEAGLVAQGYTLIKCFLHISKEEQRQRLAARLADPSKYWKYNPGDLEVRAKWDAYAEAYSAVLTRCNPDSAPWFVIPSDKKWYRNWAVAELLREKLAALDLQWPAPDFDVAVERERVARS